MDWAAILGVAVALIGVLVGLIATYAFDHAALRRSQETMLQAQANALAAARLASRAGKEAQPAPAPEPSELERIALAIELLATELSESRQTRSERVVYFVAQVAVVSGAVVAVLAFALHR